MIKQIWFDFGNIFIPVHPARTKELFKARGVQLSEETFAQLNEAYEVGELSTKQFFQDIAATCPYLQSSRAIEHAWSALLGEVHDDTLFLKKLSKSFDLALVSNTNESHINTIRKQSGPFLWNTFVERFDGLFFSYEIGHRKPEEGYFNYVLEHMNAKAEEVLFIDDSQANLDGAEALGINTWLFNIQKGSLAEKLPAVLAKLNEGTAGSLGV
jgi:putative hydrolase of the HAD superfamily